MSDALEPRPSTPFPPEGAVPAPVLADPLAGDWAEGLRGPLRALGVPAPVRLSLDGVVPPLPAPQPVVAQSQPPAAEEVEAPDAWGAASDDPLQSAPPPVASEPPSVIITFTDPPAPQPATEAAPAATSWESATAAPAQEAAPTPWSDPAPAADAVPEWSAPAAQPEPWKDAPVAMPAAAVEAQGAWDQVAAATPPPVLVTPPPEPDVWAGAPASAPAIEEWKAEAPAADWQQVKESAPAFTETPAADWGTLSSGPDWSAPPAADAASADDSWGSAPPPPAASAWDAPPAAEPSAWEAAPASDSSADAEWAAPSPPPPPSAPSWNAAPVGASALDQLDSEPQIEAAPGAAQELFGSVAVGESLSGDDDLGPPEELASPEDVLRPVEDDDPDLLVPVDEEEPPRPAPIAAKTLAMMQPVGALEVRGEHRVAVHTRGGRTRRGTMKDVDLSKSSFELVPQGGGPAEAVYHAEVKAVFFMLAPGEKPKVADGGKVRVTFADGRTIEGTRDGVDAKHGFFLVPSDAAKTNTRRIYIARDATSEIREG